MSEKIFENFWEGSRDVSAALDIVVYNVESLIMKRRHHTLTSDTVQTELKLNQELCPEGR